MNYKNLTIGLLSAVLFSACNLNELNKTDIENKVEVKGNYYGVLPCASCSGIQTKLILKNTDDKLTYILSEKYLEKNAMFINKGKATVSKNNILKLFDKEKVFRKLFIAKDYVSFDVEDKDKAYRLLKK